MAMEPLISISDRDEVLILDNGWAASYKDGVWHKGFLFTHEYLAEHFSPLWNREEAQRLLDDARAALGAPNAAHAGQEGRVLHFPDDSPVGTLYWDGGPLRTDARGTVAIPSGVQVTLYIDPLATDLSALASLPPDALTEILFNELGQPRRPNDDALDREVRHLAHLSALTCLDLAFTGITDAGLPHLARLINLRELNLSQTTISDRGLVHLAALANLEQLSLAGTAVTGGGFAHLGHLAHLRELRLDGTASGDAGMAHLGRLASLRELHLGNTAVTDAGLVPLAGLTYLERLHLYGTAITDVGLVPLGEITSLTYLDLRRNTITDAGLAHLAGLTGLRHLFLDFTRVTDDGCARLKKLLPHCRIKTW